MFEKAFLGFCVKICFRCSAFGGTILSIVNKRVPFTFELIIQILTTWPLKNLAMNGVDSQTITNMILHPNCACDPTFLWELALLGTSNSEQVTQCHISVSHCKMINVFSAVSFLFLFTVVCYNFLKFWLSVTDRFKSNIHLTYLTLMSICICKFCNEKKNHQGSELTFVS